jgi:hypothetical protein
MAMMRAATRDGSPPRRPNLTWRRGVLYPPVVAAFALTAPSLAGTYDLDEAFRRSAASESRSVRPAGPSCGMD